MTEYADETPLSAEQSRGAPMVAASERVLPSPPVRSKQTPWLWALAGLAGLALLVNAMLWQRISGMQEKLAAQSAQSLALASEARGLAKQAQTMAQESAARTTLQEARLADLSLQRSQLEDLMRSLSRSRDENLVVDIEATLRLAQQQAQLTGSVAPLLSALKNSDQRIVRAAQPNLAPLQRAIARDIEHIKTIALSDTPAILVKLEDLAKRVDQLELANAVGATAVRLNRSKALVPSSDNWWTALMHTALQQLQSLVRVSRIEMPEAVLLSPEQGFFLQENLKLKLLNVRMALLTRQVDQARDELDEAQLFLKKYFDMTTSKAKSTMALLKLIQTQLRQLDVPRIDQTLSVLASATAGR